MTTTAKAAKTAPTGLWADADVIAGNEPVDKATLIGKPFLINRIDYGTSSRSQYGMVTVNAVDKAGKEFYFTDASTGVRDQLTKYLTEVKKVDVDWTAGSYEVKLACFGGLRASTYETEVRPDTYREAKTYYIVLEAR